MPKPKPNKYDQQHRANIDAIAKMVDRLYDIAVKEAASIASRVDVDTSKPFSFSDYPITQKEVHKMLDDLGSNLETVILDGIQAEWTLANNKNNELSRRVFGDNIGKLTQQQYRQYFSNNDDARQAFIQRKEQGLNLSERVWNYAEQFKDDIEMGLDIGIRTGLDAPAMARQLKQFLNHPDMLFRRVRDEHGILHLSQRAKQYHPGQGVYRSSYKNARRLAVTETNMAYQAADHARWQQLDFVVGIEIRLSGNHTCLGRDGKPHEFHDICDELQGRYPKDFKFVGWHPHCRCIATSILKTEKELMEENKAILRGEQPTQNSTNAVNDVPEAFKTWLQDNEERIARAKSLPYFLRDNPMYTGYTPRYNGAGIVKGTKLGRTATKKASNVYKGYPAPKLSKEVQDNTASIASIMGIKQGKPMTFLEANEGRSNASWGKGEKYSENCQISVVVHEARLRGLDVTAIGFDNNPNSVQYRLARSFQDIWKNPKTNITPTPDILKEETFDEMLKKLLGPATKAIGRYHIGINPRDEKNKKDDIKKNEGHVITAERLPDGQIYFYDPQIGVFVNFKEYEAKDIEYLEVLKVDKLLIRPDLFKVIARPFSL